MSLSLRSSPRAADPNTKAARIRSAIGRRPARSTSARPAVFKNIERSSGYTGDRLSAWKYT